VNTHFEIVSGARRYRAAKLAGLREAPVRIVVLTDAEALETQIICNSQGLSMFGYGSVRGLHVNDVLRLWLL